MEKRFQDLNIWESSIVKNMENEIKLQVGVKVLIKNKEGKYLLLKRSDKKYPNMEGKWDIVGGRIDPGKTLIENLKREIEEETSLSLKEDPKLICAQDIIRGEDVHVVRLTYIGKADGDVKLDSEEHVSCKWVSEEELRSFDDLDIYFKEVLRGDTI